MRGQGRGGEGRVKWGTECTTVFLPYLDRTIKIKVTGVIKSAVWTNLKWV